MPGCVGTGDVEVWVDGRLWTGRIFYLAFFITAREATLSPISSAYFREQSSVEVPDSMHSQGALQGVGEKKTIK